MSNRRQRFSRLAGRDKPALNVNRPHPVAVWTQSDQREKPPTTPSPKRRGTGVMFIKTRKKKDCEKSNHESRGRRTHSVWKGKAHTSSDCTGGKNVTFKRVKIGLSQAKPYNRLQGASQQTDTERIFGWTPHNKHTWAGRGPPTKKKKKKIISRQRLRV